MQENGYFNVLTVFSVRIWMESGKNKQEYVHFLYFFINILQIFRFFLQGEINCWGGRDRKISALVSALVSAPVSALYLTLGSQGWTALFDGAGTLGPKV